MAAPGFKSLAPIPDVDFDCPGCDLRLDTTDWYVPGMRVLASLRCPSCGREFYGDVQTGDARGDPILLSKSSGKTMTPRDDYFSTWLRESYADRTTRRLNIDFDQTDGLARPALVNCLDHLYGHSLLKLLNVQYLLEKTNADPVVLVPANLEWLVPDNVPAVWSVDLSFSQGNEWNDWLAARIDREIESHGSFEVCLVPPHPSGEQFDIERFTGVMPYDLSNWEDTPDNPRITFVWRGDRHWSPVPPADVARDWLDSNTRLWPAENPLVVHTSKILDITGRFVQHRRILSLAKRLRNRFSDLIFSVVGVGKPPSFPEWVETDVVARPDPEAERRLCQRYANTHVAIGVHGSNMLLPSAHAGSVIDLTSARRWGNLTQDLLLRDVDLPQALFHYQLLPLDAAPSTVAEVVIATLTKRTAYD